MYTNNLNSKLIEYNNSINYSNNISSYNGFSDLNFSTKDNSLRTITLAPNFENWNENSSTNFLQTSVQNYCLNELKLNSKTNDLSLTTSKTFEIISSPKHDLSNQCDIGNIKNSSKIYKKNFLSHLSAMYLNNNNNNFCASTDNFNIAQNTNNLQLFSSQARNSLPYKTGPGSNSIFSKIKLYFYFNKLINNL